ncbi:MAG: hypothetical protein Q9219_006355 [cf. Caloplaca sp. 3 TL-2023]
MVDHNQCLERRFLLRWRSQAVGTITYAWEPSYQGMGSGATPPESLPQSWLGEVDDVLVDTQIQELPGGDLDVNDIVMVLVGGMTDIAVHDFYSQVNGGHFKATYAPYRGIFELSPSIPPSTSSTWFTYEIVRYVIGKLAIWYLSREVWRPAQIVMLRQGLFCGHGRFLGDSKPLELAAKGGEQNITAV